MKGVPRAGARTCGSSRACPECEGHIRRGESQDAIMTHRIRGFWTRPQSSLRWHPRVQATMRTARLQACALLLEPSTEIGPHKRLYVLDRRFEELS